jgi:hypothetical protein
MLISIWAKLNRKQKKELGRSSGQGQSLTFRNQQIVSSIDLYIVLSAVFFTDLDSLCLFLFLISDSLCQDLSKLNLGSTKCFLN